MENKWLKYRMSLTSDAYFEKLRYTNESLEDCKIRVMKLREKKLAKGRASMLK